VQILIILIFAALVRLGIRFHLEKKLSGKRATFIVLTGPSGVGKTTTCELLLKKLAASRISSITTRTPRAHDPEGEYRYFSDEAFDDLAKQGAFLWTAEFRGKRYGTLAEDIARAVQERGVYVLPLLPHQTETLEQRLTGTAQLLPFFLTAPDATLAERLRGGRGLDEARIATELETAHQMLRHVESSSTRFIVISTTQTKTAVVDAILDRKKLRVTTELQNQLPESGRPD
jgi:guanylate kinase